MIYIKMFKLSLKKKKKNLIFKKKKKKTLNIKKKKSCLFHIYMYYVL